MNEAAVDAGSARTAATDLPRLLFVTPHAFNKTTGTGITFTNLFGGWPKDGLATVHDDAEPTTDDVCARYYALGDAEIRRWAPARWLRPGGVAAAGGEAPSAARAGGPSVAAKRLIFGDGLPQSGRLSAELDRWIAAFEPDVVYTILGSIGLMEMIDRVRTRFALPLVVHLMDDWPSVQFRRGLLAPWQRRRMQGLLERLIGAAALRIGICEAMCRAFERRYGAPFVAFQNTVDAARWAACARDPVPVGEPATIVYAGSVFATAQLESLVDCCRAVAALNGGGRAVNLDIYSPESLVGAHRARLEVHPAIRVRPPLTDDAAFFGTLADADGLLVPANFDPESVRFIRYSMPTRVPAYLAAGTPILVHGPAGIAQVDYARDAGWGLVVDDRGIDGLKAAIARLLDDGALRMALADRAKATALAHHDRARVRARFRDALTAVANAPRASLEGAGT